MAKNIIVVAILLGILAGTMIVQFEKAIKSDEK